MAAAATARHFQHPQSIAGDEHDIGALQVFERTVAIADNLFEAFGVGSVQEDADGLCDGCRLARFRDFVNPMPASLHQMVSRTNRTTRSGRYPILLMTVWVEAGERGAMR